jgi:hypothetical protein
LPRFPLPPRKVLMNPSSPPFLGFSIYFKPKHFSI